MKKNASEKVKIHFVSILSTYNALCPIIGVTNAPAMDIICDLSGADSSKVGSVKTVAIAQWTYDIDIRVSGVVRFGIDPQD